MGSTSKSIDYPSLQLALTEDAILAEKARTSYKHFVAYTKLDYDFAWHNLLLMDHLQKMIDGKIQRLLVFEPPRHGKTELVSRRLPAFCFGQRPDMQIIGSSYGLSLAAKINRDIQKIMVDPRYKAVFPEVQIGRGKEDTKQDTNYLKNSEVFEIVNHRGMYKASGVGTGITGLGFDLGIIDDPIKDQDQARSLTYRDKVWDWFTSTFYTRAQKNAQLLVTLTRWNEDDLAGRILNKIQQGEEGWDNWHILNLPAIAEETTAHAMVKRHPQDRRKIGEALWPNAFDEKSLRAIKNTVGSQWWNSLYQQRPSSQEGGIIKRSWLKYYKALPGALDQKIMTIDTTFKGGKHNDFCVAQVWGLFGPNKYLIDEIRGQWSFTEAMEALRQFCAKHPDVFVKLIEDTANGPAIIDSLSKVIPGIIPFKPKESKEARLSAVSPEFEAGNVWLPDPDIAPWIGDYIEELMVFPNGANDDRVDATSCALLRFREGTIDFMAAMGRM